MIIQARRFALCALHLSTSCVLLAQYHDEKYRPDHDHVPPGQAKKYDEGRALPPGQAKKYDEGRALPPGQAKKYFRNEDRDRFYPQYHRDAEHWRHHKRPVFVPGQYIGREYVVQSVPRSVWVSTIAPPPGYQYGYYGGYVVAYSPTTRMIADVLDLIDTARTR